MKVISNYLLLLADYEYFYLYFLFLDIYIRVRNKIFTSRVYNSYSTYTVWTSLHVYIM